MWLVGKVLTQYGAYDYGFGSDYDCAELYKSGFMDPNTPQGFVGSGPPSGASF